MFQEHKTYEEVIEHVNVRLDSILKATQQTIHRVTDLLVQSVRQDKRLIICPNWKVFKGDDASNEIHTDGNIENFIQSVEGTKNAIDRLVMNGSRNVTAKCELLTDDGVFLCLNAATEEINSLSHSLLDRLESLLVACRHLLCSESMEIL